MRIQNLLSLLPLKKKFHAFFMTYLMNDFSQSNQLIDNINRYQKNEKKSLMS